MKTYIKNYSSKGKKFFVKILPSIFLICVSFLFFYVGMHSMKNAYQSAKEEAYNGYYETAYQWAEQRNHVHNSISISIDNVKEVTRLEVLTVTSSEFIIKDADINDRTTSWLEVRGTGIFTVDLSAGEFIIDSNRQYVLVRVPKPALTECKISDTKQLILNDNRIISNGSVGDGVRLSQTQLGEGRLKLEDSMKKSRRFHDAALEATKTTIISLVQEWNPNIPNLNVEVVFIDNDLST